MSSIFLGFGEVGLAASCDHPERIVLGAQRWRFDAVSMRKKKGGPHFWREIIDLLGVRYVEIRS